LVKLSPLPPRRLASETVVPAGEIREISRSPSQVCVNERRTSTSATLPAAVMVSGTVTPLAG
jgi:hypothetical protein